MNRPKVLFLHLPKTAGSTIKNFFKTALDDFAVQANAAGQLTPADPQVVRVRDMADIRRVLAERGGLALHVDSNLEAVRRSTDFRSLAPLVFEPEHIGYFERFTILAMLRHPFRRFVSEYAFLRRMKERDHGFLPDLELTTIDAFLEHSHPNAALHFLLEHDLHRRREMTRDDLERVKERMAGYPIHVGIYERFNETIAYFARVLGRQFQASDLPALNVGTKEVAVDSRIESAFYERNGLDLALYDYAVRRFDEVSGRPS